MIALRVAWEDPRDGSVTSCPITNVAQGVEEAQELIEAGRIRHAWVRDQHGHIVYERHVSS